MFVGASWLPCIEAGNASIIVSGGATCDIMVGNKDDCITFPGCEYDDVTSRCSHLWDHPVDVASQEGLYYLHLKLNEDADATEAVDLGDDHVSYVYEQTTACNHVNGVESLAFHVNGWERLYSKEMTVKPLKEHCIYMQRCFCFSCFGLLNLLFSALYLSFSVFKTGGLS